MRKGIKITLGAIALGVIVVVVGLLLAIKPLLTRYVVAQARDRGVELVPGELRYGIGWVELDGFSFKLVGVRGLTGKLARAHIELDGLSPSKITLDGVDTQASGPPAAIALDVARWAQRYGGSFSGTPLAAHGIQLTYLSQHGSGKWLSVEGGELGKSSDGASMLSAKKVSVLGHELGSADALWRRSATQVQLGVGAHTLSNAPLRVELGYAGDKPSASIELAEVPLSTLNDTFQLGLPVDHIKAKAHVALSLGDGTGPLGGSLDLTLKGWVPPHPRELDEIVFGSATTVKSKFRIDADRTHVVLSDIKLTAGSFALGGTGVVTREQDHARIQLDLKGSLACATVAESAADSHLGRVVGHWLGMAAHQALNGSVGVVVKIDADTRKLSDAKILRTIGVGCGLKPLKLPDLADLPEFDLSKLPGLPDLGLPSPGASSSAGSLPPLPGHLPALPSGMPALPVPPKFDLPGFGTPPKDTTKQAAPKKESTQPPPPKTSAPKTTAPKTTPAPAASH